MGPRSYRQRNDWSRRNVLRRRGGRSTHPRKVGGSIDWPKSHAYRGAQQRDGEPADGAIVHWSGISRRVCSRHRSVDIFGKVCGQPVHQMLGGLCRDKLRVYNTCAGYRYVRSRNIRPGSNWNVGESEGPFEDLDAFMNRADALAESLLESGITAMKIWPFDPPAQENGGLYISAAEMKKAIEPFEKIRKAVGDRMDIMVEFHSLWNLPTAKKIARALEPFAPMWYEAPIRMNSPQALAEYARSTDVWVCASETFGSRWPFKDFLEKDALHVAMVDLCW